MQSEQPPVEVPVVPPAAPQASMPVSQKSNKKLLLLIGVPVLLILLVAAFLLLRNNANTTPKPATDDTAMDETDKTPDTDTDTDTEVSYECADPTFMNDDKSIYYCSEKEDFTKDPQYATCVSKIDSAFQTNVKDEESKLKNSAKFTFYSTKSDNKLTISRNALKDDCELQYFDDANALGTLLKENRFLEYTVYSSTLCYCSGAGSKTNIFDFETGADFETASGGDGGGFPVSKFFIPRGSNLVIISVMPSTLQFATLQVQKFDLTTGTKVDSKDVSLGESDIPEYARSTIKPEYGAEFFYEDKEIDVKSFEFSGNEYTIKYEVTNNLDVETITINRYPDFKQTGELKVTI